MENILWESMSISRGGGVGWKKIPQSMNSTVNDGSVNHRRLRSAFECGAREHYVAGDKPTSNRILPRISRFGGICSE